MTRSRPDPDVSCLQPLPRATQNAWASRAPTDRKRKNTIMTTPATNAPGENSHIYTLSCACRNVKGKSIEPANFPCKGIQPDWYSATYGPQSVLSGGSRWLRRLSRGCHGRTRVSGARPGAGVLSRRRGDSWRRTVKVGRPGYLGLCRGRVPSALLWLTVAGCAARVVRRGDRPGVPKAGSSRKRCCFHELGPPC